MTYFFKNGKTKAEGEFVDNLMESEWKFYRETGGFGKLEILKSEKEWNMEAL